MPDWILTTGEIDASHLYPQILEKSPKEQGKGTGLGLAAAYGTIVQHKGAIMAHSLPGKGACFQILLPLTQESAPDSQTTETPTRGQGTILLIDDELVMRATGEELLEDCGYEVLLAENGEDGVNIYRERHNEIDLVICDMIMPKMNGRDCFHALKAIRPDVRVVLASGFTVEEDLDELKGAGLKGFIQKPFHSAELSRIIAETLKK